MLKIQVQFAKGQPTYDIPLLGPTDEPASLKDEGTNSMLVMRAHENYSEVISIDLNKTKVPQLGANLRAVDLLALNPKNAKFITYVIKGESYEKVFKSKAGKGKVFIQHV